MRNIMLATLILVALQVAASDAATKSVRADAGSSDADVLTSAEDKVDDQQCTSYGAKVGSAVYVDCRLKLAEMRQNQTSATKTPASERAIRCRTIQFGGIVRTRCR
jgi:hypothetical protein